MAVWEMILFSATHRRITASGMVVECVIVDWTPGFDGFMLFRLIETGDGGDVAGSPFSLNAPKVADGSKQVDIAQVYNLFWSSYSLG